MARTSHTLRLTTALIALLSLAALAPAASKEQVLYSFQGGTDGSRPIDGTVFDKAGNLYGATVNGGASTCRGPFQCGTVYQLKPPLKKGDPWTETVLYVFQGTDHNDGGSPFGGLIFDASGNLYGTTGYNGTGPCQMFGGQVGCGTVYELSPPSVPGGNWTETVLYNFQGGKDGQFPYGGLVFDQQGNLYGATYYGGGFGSCNDPFFQHCGTIFELSPPKKKGGKWTEKVLYSFRNGKDGANPNGSLVFDKKGVLYGTTYFGGKEVGDCSGGSGGTGCGTVFALVPPATNGGKWTFQPLHIFRAGSNDGANPAAAIAFDTRGYLYGTTFAGPQNGWGTIFELKRSSGKGHSWNEEVIYRFTHGADGSQPRCKLVFDSQGHLYGTGSGGGAFGGGTLFQLQSHSDVSWTLTTLYDFAGHPDGSYPSGNLTFNGTETKLFGTTEQSGNTEGVCGNYGCGTVFAVSK